MEDNTYELRAAWQKIEESNIQGMVPVQGISMNPEYEGDDMEEEPMFDYKVAKHKLDSIYTNVGSGAQSGRNDSFDLFQRTIVPSTEYEDTTLASGTLDEVLAKAQQINPGKQLKEVDSPEEAIARRDKEEKTSNMDRLKTLKLDGVIADLLDREMQTTGNVEWTDGFQGNGPYLPPEVEKFICNAAGNTTEEPFKVRFIKYGSSHPSEGRKAPLYVEYEQDVVNNPQEFGNRDL